MLTMEVENILTAATFDSLNKLEWSVILCNLTDHVRANPKRFELIKSMLLEWNANKTSRLPIYLATADQSNL